MCAVQPGAGFDSSGLLVDLRVDDAPDAPTALGHRDGDVAAALASWSSVRNVEVRLTPDGIDARVLDALRSESR